MTKLSSAQTVDINALVALLIIFLTIYLLFWLWIYKSYTSSSLRQNHSESWCLCTTFPRSVIINTWAAMWPIDVCLRKDFLCFEISFLMKNITYQSDLQNLHCKCNCIVLSSFLLNAFNSYWSLGTERTWLFTGRAETFKESSTN